MGRKPQYKPKVDSEALSKPNDAVLLAFDNVPAENFALVTQGVDLHRLRIFDTQNSTVKRDFSSSQADKFTCLRWGVTPAHEPVAKKARSAKSSTAPSKVIALGLQNGTIGIYSLAHGALTATLNGGHTAPVTDVVLSRSGKVAYSVGEDSQIVAWNVVEASVTSKWKVEGQRINKLALSNDETKLLAAGHSIQLWNLKSQSLIQTYSGHANNVTNIIFSSDDDFFVSAAEHDRFINVWDTTAEQKDRLLLAELAADNDLIHIDLSAANDAVLAITEEGVVHLWQNASSASSTAASKLGRKKKSSVRFSESSIRVLSDKDASTIPILSATFLAQSGEVLIARNSAIKPIFEIVRYLDDRGEIISEIDLTRQLISGYLIDDEALAANNLKATQKAYDESGVKVLGQVDFGFPDQTVAEGELEDLPNGTANGQTLEEKLQDLAMAESAADDTKTRKSQARRVQTPKANSLQQMLVQALHSNDVQLLEACLAHTDPDIIRNTVRRLPTAYVIPFLTQLITKFQVKPNRGPALLEWIKAVLLIHAAYLMTVPNLVKQLSNFYQALDSRLSGFNKLLNLQGRLDLVQSQIAMRQQYKAEDITNEAINIYNEEDDVSEDEDALADFEDDEDEMEANSDVDMAGIPGDMSLDEGENDEQEDDEDEEDEEDDDDDLSD